MAMEFKLTAISLPFFLTLLIISGVQLMEIYNHRTRLGRLNGLKITSANSTIYQFKKVPFALAPIGSLRFKKPRTTGAWKATLDARYYGYKCIQDNRINSNKYASEDCLHLNIFSPHDLMSNSRRPVLIWVHGGGFVVGQSTYFDGTKLSLLGNVIVVTINYRLNIFGFVNAGKGTPRNVGLWDQRFAINWVKDNIEDYGGDPQTITIFGESSGGGSVALQSIIPLNKRLFHRAIAESGSTLTAIRDTEDSEKLTKEIGRTLNCSECLRGGISCLDCLGKIPTKNLLTAYAESVTRLYTGFSLKNRIGPVVDGDLIPDNPMAMLSNPTSAASVMFNSIDYITGTNDCEGGLYLYTLKDQQAVFNINVSLGIPSRVVCDYIAPYVASEILKGCDEVSQAICTKYSSNGSLSYQTDLAVNLLSDVEFSSLAERDLDFHSRSDKGTYEYLFTHKRGWGLPANRPRWLLGANHYDEVVFVIGIDTWYPNNENVSSYESNLSLKMMTFWLNFAKTGDPNPNGTPEWLPYTKTNRSFMLLGEYRNSTVDNFYARARFWNEEIPNLIHKCPKTISNLTAVNSGFG